MSYCVEYNPEQNARYPRVHKQSRKIPMKALLILLFAAVGTYVVLDKHLLHYLIPGDPEVTVAALSELVENIGEGESFKNAVQTFIQDIIIHGV